MSPAIHISPAVPTTPRIHDLLEIHPQRFLAANSSAPTWVAESLRHAPFVVVRRGATAAEGGAPAAEGEIAVGVRGSHRNERWASVCHPNLVKRILPPPMLLSRLVTASPSALATGQALAIRPTLASRPLPPTRTNTIPALRTLALLADRWSALNSPWGPGGSVGFELATAHPVATPQSDLDIVIYADSHMTHEEARGLHESAQGLPATVDIRVETPICGFSLTEYAKAASPAPILLRFPHGTALGPNPWATPT